MPGRPQNAEKHFSFLIVTEEQTLILSAGAEAVKRAAFN